MESTFKYFKYNQSGFSSIIKAQSDADLCNNLSQCNQNNLKPKSGENSEITFDDQQNINLVIEQESMNQSSKINDKSFQNNQIHKDQCLENVENIDIMGQNFKDLNENSGSKVTIQQIIEEKTQQSKNSKTQNQQSQEENENKINIQEDFNVQNNIYQQNNNGSNLFLGSDNNMFSIQRLNEYNNVKDQNQDEIKENDIESQKNQEQYIFQSQNDQKDNAIQQIQQENKKNHEFKKQIHKSIINLGFSENNLFQRDKTFCEFAEYKPKKNNLKTIFNFHNKIKRKFQKLINMLPIYNPNDKLSLLFTQVQLIFDAYLIFFTSIIYYLKLINLLMLIILWAHIMACIYYIVAQFQIIMYDEKQTWLDIAGITYEPFFKQYRHSFFVASSSMITVLVYSPKTDMEITFVAIIMIFNCGFFGYSINSLGIIMQEITRQTDSQEREINILMDFMVHKKIQKDLVLRTKNYLQYVHTQEQEQQSKALKNIIPKLSQQLQGEVVYQANKKYLEFMDSIIKHFPQQVQQIFVTIMEERMYSPNEIIHKSQNIEQYKEYGLNIIIKGQIVYKQKESEICQLKPGQMFGLDYFFTGIEKQEYTMKALKYSNVIFIDREKFIQEILKIKDKDIQQKSIEIFHNMKDKILFQNNCEELGQTCNICDQKDHLVYNCNKIQYNPNALDLIESQKCFLKQQRLQYYREQKDIKFKYALESQELIEESMIYYMNQNMKLLMNYEVENYLQKYDCLLEYFLQIHLEEHKLFLLKYYPEDEKIMHNMTNSRNVKFQKNNSSNNNNNSQNQQRRLSRRMSSIVTRQNIKQIFNQQVVNQLDIFNIDPKKEQLNNKQNDNIKNKSVENIQDYIGNINIVQNTKQDSKSECEFEIDQDQDQKQIFNQYQSLKPSKFLNQQNLNQKQQQNLVEELQKISMTQSANLNDSQLIQLSNLAYNDQSSSDMNTTSPKSIINIKNSQSLHNFEKQSNNIDQNLKNLNQKQNKNYTQNQMQKTISQTSSGGQFVTQSSSSINLQKGKTKNYNKIGGQGGNHQRIYQQLKYISNINNNLQQNSSLASLDDTPGRSSQKQMFFTKQIKNNEINSPLHNKSYNQRQFSSNLQESQKNYHLKQQTSVFDDLKSLKSVRTNHDMNIINYENEKKQFYIINDFDVQRDYEKYLPHNNLSYIIENNSFMKKKKIVQNSFHDQQDYIEKIKQIKNQIKQRKSQHFRNSSDNNKNQQSEGNSEQINSTTKYLQQKTYKSSIFK